MGIKVEGVEHIVDAVSSKRDTNATESGHTEDTCQVVISSSTCYAAYLHVKGFHFKYGSGIIVESTGQCQVKLQLVLESGLLQDIKDETSFLDTFHAHL